MGVLALVPNLANPVLLAILAGVSAVLAAAGYSLPVRRPTMADSAYTPDLFASPAEVQEPALTSDNSHYRKPDLGVGG